MEIMCNFREQNKLPKIYIIDCCWQLLVCVRKFFQGQVKYLDGDALIKMIGGAIKNRNWIEAEPLIPMFIIKISHEHHHPNDFKVI